MIQDNKVYSLTRLNETSSECVDQDGIHYDNAARWLWSDILGGCGCGSSDDLAALAVDVLRGFASGEFDRKQIQKEPAREVIAHWMDSLGLLEHGWSISGSWVTRRGEMIWKAIEKCGYPIL